MKFIDTQNNETPSLFWRRVFSKKTIFVIVLVVVIGGFFIGGSFTYAKIFENKIYPGVRVGSIYVGGKTSEQAQDIIQTQINLLLQEAVPFEINGDQVLIEPTEISTTSTEYVRDYVSFNLQESLGSAYDIGRGEKWYKNVLSIIGALVQKNNQDLSVDLDRELLTEILIERFGDYHHPAENADFKIVTDYNGWQITVTEPKNGKSLNLEKVFSEMEINLSQLVIKNIRIEILDETVTITHQQAKDLRNNAIKILNQAPYELTYNKNDYNSYSWTLSDIVLAPMLSPVTTEGGVMVGVRDISQTELMTMIAEDAEEPTLDAKFALENSKVTEFQGASNGVLLDKQGTAGQITSMINSGKTSTEIIIIIDEPDVATADVNDLGIKEILGVGTSDFSGSPRNRISNISHGSDKLNGLLIAPDEEFSLVTALKPFTVADGYLPELVIRGDEIIPEVGGGLCQIGTTTFRTAMNSGLPISSRSNHSLVVSYYNDPSNGNPGTDATIYDPIPDLKFINDTGYHILFTTEVDTYTDELEYTFWGTNDGRNGYYSPPVVQNWIGVGEDKMIETTDLEPGEQNCQGAHVGANASFTYYVEQADGTVDETLYSSYYRPLPKICLVGVDPEALEECDEEDENCQEEEETEEE